MLDQTRLRNPALFAKIVTPDKAAELIEDGMNVGVSRLSQTNDHGSGESH